MACKNSLPKGFTGLIIFTTVGLVGIIGGGFYTYKYITSGNLRSCKSKIMGDIQSVFQVLSKMLPSRTGNSVPLPFNEYLRYIHTRLSIPNISVQIIPPVRVFGGYISHPSFSEPSITLLLQDTS